MKRNGIATVIRAKAQGFGRNMTPIRSSAIAGIVVNGDEQRFLFHSGSLSRRYRIPADVLRDFMEAKSKGSYYAANIRGRF